MDPERIGQLTRILQLSITPVALISGIGLLLLSMTNRLGRVIDRSREVANELSGESRSGAGAPTGELPILFRRARFLLFAIGSIATSIFLAVVTVALLFAMNLLAANLSIAILVLFAICLLCLVGSLIFFLGDIVLSIRWLRVSIGGLNAKSSGDSR
ncbi:MAG: DUF2721 domain-containing protein [Kofleriaceae bacterium]